MKRPAKYPSPSRRPFSRRTMFVAALLAAAPVVALSAQDGPESLLPPGFDDPAPAPSPAPAPRPTPTSTQGGGQSAPSLSQPVVQQVPDSSASAPTTASSSRADAARRLLERLPSLDELEDMDTDEIDEILGLKPTFDIPDAARRSTARARDVDGYADAWFNVEIVSPWRAPGVMRYIAAAEVATGEYFIPVVPEQLASRLRDASR